MEWARQIYWPGVLSLIGGGVAGCAVAYCALRWNLLAGVIAFALSFIPPAIGHLFGHYVNDWLGVNSPERIAERIKKEREKRPPDAS